MALEMKFPLHVRVTMGWLAPPPGLSRQGQGKECVTPMLDSGQLNKIDGKLKLRGSSSIASHPSAESSKDCHFI